MPAEARALKLDEQSTGVYCFRFAISPFECRRTANNFRKIFFTCTVPQLFSSNDCHGTWGGSLVSLGIVR